MGRDGRNIEFEGVVKNLTEWGKKYGLDKTHIHWRLKKGWTISDALTKPLRKKPRRLPQSIRKQKKTMQLIRKNKKTKKSCIDN